MLSHQELKKKTLTRPDVLRTLNTNVKKKEFALLDLMLTARCETNLT